MGQALPETRRPVVNLSLVGIGLLLGAVAWPRYAKEKPLGVIALGVSGSMISSGIIGLLLGSTGSS